MSSRHNIKTPNQTLQQTAGAILVSGTLSSPWSPPLLSWIVSSVWLAHRTHRTHMLPTCLGVKRRSTIWQAPNPQRCSSPPSECRLAN